MNRFNDNGEELECEQIENNFSANPNTRSIWRKGIIRKKIKKYIEDNTPSKYLYYKKNKVLAQQILNRTPHLLLIMILQLDLNLIHQLLPMLKMFGIVV